MAKKEEHVASATTSNTKPKNGTATQGKVVPTIVSNGGLVADNHSPEATGIVR